jgi:hypothetical protein
MSKNKIWFCKIGEVDESLLPFGSDFPMRQAIKEAYFKLTGRYPNFLFSGWTGELTKAERNIVDSKTIVKSNKDD